jgi:hypothetical protein
MDPEFRERSPRFVIDENGKERLSVEGKLLGNPRGIGSLVPSVSGRDRQGQHPEIFRRAQGRVRPALAHRRHGCGRHRCRLPLSESRICSPAPKIVRAGRTDDIAHAAVFLASDEA